MLSRARGTTYTFFVSWVGSVQNFTGTVARRGRVQREGTGTASVVKLVRWSSGTRTAVKNIAGTAPRVGTASEGIMVVSDEEVAVLIAEVEREKKDLESIRREKETIRRETEAIKADLEEKNRELERLQYGTDLRWRQSETMDRQCYPGWRDRRSRRRRKWHFLQKHLRLK